MAPLGWRAGLVLPIVALSIAAGCIGPGSGGAPPTLTTPTNATNATCFNSCNNLAAFQETNATVQGGMDGMNHAHDYWNGRERVTLFEVTTMMSPSPDASNQAVADFHPPQGTFVYEGTDHVEFTISNPQRHACEPVVTLGGFYICTDNTANTTPVPSGPPAPDPTGGPSGLILKYKHAAASDWIDAGPIAWGKPTIIQITHPTQVDMPHSTASAWEFEVVSPNPYDVTLEFTARADIVRGAGPIPLWPPHPDFYANGPSRVVLQQADVVACDGNSCKLPGNEKAGPIAAQKLISYGTKTLYVFLNVTDFQAPLPVTAPTTFFLWHWNSTGYDNITTPFDKNNHGVDKKNHEWILPVDDNGMDSPYADGSKWKFELGAGFTPPAGPSCYSGCADWSAKYTITVIATNQELPLSQYDMSCLRGDYCPHGNSTSTAADAATPADAQPTASPFAPAGPAALAAVPARP
jgi:hypothetical protein